MLLWPLRWVLRQLISLIASFLIVGLVFLWSLRWIPFPPLPVLQGFFHGSTPKWGWVGEKEQPASLIHAFQWVERQPTRQRSPALPQRTAELIFYPTKASTWGSSLLGALIEGLWGERRLLTFYLNSIPYDTNVYGVKAASECLFRKSLEKLSPEEIAELIVRRQWPYLSQPIPTWLEPEYRRLKRHISLYQDRHAS
ncbi:MAG: transglycosylase domain-containing protein [Bacteroidia bacterium]|nr:transglycosylase domain-containing protein [Bacteroidia bacterium]